MTSITLTNPWTGRIVERDITGLTQDQLDAYAQVMDDDICNALAREMAPCTPEDYLAAYCERVGPDAAGIVVLGS